MEATKVRAYGYIRVSTPLQCGTKNISLSLQTRTIQEYCESNNYDLVEMVEDAAVSGTLTVEQHSKLSILLSKLGKGDVVLTYNVARFSRNLVDLIKVVDDIMSKGVIFIAIKDECDTSSYDGCMKIRIFASAAEQEVTEMSERTSEAIRYHIKQGRHMGSVPYGYKKRNQAKGSGIVEVPEEQAVIAYIKQRRDEKVDGVNISYRQIARELDEKGVARPGKGKKWGHEVVQRLYERGSVGTKGRPEFELEYK
jgi:DNA invertase Pin-like site-specific DNA recombinase